jgi:hypothetical protein
MRRTIATTTAALLILAGAPTAWAAVDTPGRASGASPFAAGCHGAPQAGTLYLGSEVEPWVEVNPTNPSRLVGVYQQDRFSSGGSSGQGVSISNDGGANWSQLPVSAWPKFSRCNGAAPGSAGDFERATDPWVSFGPDGRAYQISLAFNDTRNLDNAVLVSRSTNGGSSWDAVQTIRRDNDPNVFNDKESITADWTNASNVYAIWDRLVFPTERAQGVSFLTAAAFRGPTWFARSTNGGSSWEPARPIFDPGQNDQTIGNQIAALPDGDLVNVMTVFRNDNQQKRKGGFISVLRSTTKGATWSGEIPVNRLGTVAVTDPETGEDVRTGDIIPDIATDRRAGTDNVYVVWQDARFTGFARDQIAFAKSTDGGLTWSAPVRINAVKSTQAFTASIEVDAAGNLGVTYLDFRNNNPATPALETDLWFLRSTNGGASWSEERVTPASFDMRAAPNASGLFVGDYLGLDSDGTTFKPFWAQSMASGTDTFGTTVRAPFAAPTIVPDPNEAAGVSSADFPVQHGRPAPS